MAIELDAANVVAGQAKQGGVYLAPKGTTLPTDATTALEAAWVSLGYVSDDGVTIGQDLETEEINAWQSSSPIKTVVTKRVASVEFTLIEIRPETLALYFGAVPVAAVGEAFSVIVTSAPSLPEYAIVVDVLDGYNNLRFTAGRAQLSEAGDIEVKRDGAIGLPVTLGTLDDDGVLMMIYSEATGAQVGP
jgi:hypothetical protein